MKKNTTRQDTSKCPKCKTGQALDDHTCPFNDELNKKKSLCNCCTNCRRECARDV